MTCNHDYSRIEKLRNQLDEGEGYLITSRENVRYLNGFGGEGILIISTSEALFITDFRYMLDAKKLCSGFEVFDIRAGIAALIPKNLRKLYIEKSMPFGMYSDYCKKFSSISFEADNGILDTLRKVKTLAEISAIQTAAEIGCRAYENVLNYIRPGVSEKTVAAELEYLMRKYGGEGTSFSTIIASGENSAMPHAMPQDKPIQHGDFVTIDFGCVYDSYCSDMTRTVVIGEASERHIEVYDTVLEAQLKSLNEVRAGVSCRDTDALAREIITEAGYGDCFGHSLGHGVGLLIHEEPRLSSTCADILAKDMVVTVEPGIYIEGFGGVRIEDLVVVTDSLPNILTKTKKDLLIL